uniref:Uncharacterized protein n=1 Tax=Knipowitschia caucasica TaxID=637954 RepID=A0AAV2LQR6_KNICA
MTTEAEITTNSDSGRVSLQHLWVQRRQRLKAVGELSQDSEYKHWVLRQPEKVLIHRCLWWILGQIPGTLYCDKSHGSAVCPAFVFSSPALPQPPLSFQSRTSGPSSRSERTPIAKSFNMEMVDY